MPEHDRRRRRAVTLVFVGLGAVIVLVAAAIAVALLTDTVVDEERRTPPTVPISVPSETAAAPTGTVTVERVVAGDEIVISNGSQEFTVRVAGIDAPDVATDQCWSKESLSFAERMLEGQQVATGGSVPADGVSLSIRLSDGTDFATAAVEAGMARAVSSIDLTTAEQRARTAGAGLWGEYCEGQVFPPIDGPTQPPPTPTVPPTS